MKDDFKDQKTLRLKKALIFILLIKIVVVSLASQVRYVKP